MHLLLATTESFLTQGSGIATYTEHAVRAHLAAGHSVTLLVANAVGAAVKPFSHAGFDLVEIGAGEIAERSRVPHQNPSAFLPILFHEHIARIVAGRKIDLIEGQDYLGVMQHTLMMRRAGFFDTCPPVVVFGHGMDATYAAHQGAFPTLTERRRHLGELQAAEKADMFIAPSTACARDVARFVKRTEHVRVIPEPHGGARKAPTGNPAVFCHLGRVSFAKGPDSLCHFLNSIRPHWPIERVDFIGTLVESPFRRRDMRDYIAGKLHPELRGKLEFTGSLSREEAIARAAQSGVHANFSRAETFSYAQLETLQSGVAPVVLAGSPMSEFVPADLAGGVIEREKFELGELEGVMEFWCGSDRAEKVARAQKHAAELTDPARFVERYWKEAEPLLKRPARVFAAPMFAGSDVTFLITTHNEGPILLEALESLAKQSAAVGEVIVGDDGSTDPAHLAVLEQVAKRDRTRVVRGPNVGPVVGRRRLLGHAKTKLIAFMDADDTLRADAVEKMLHVLARNPDAHAAIPWRINFGTSRDLVTDFPLGTPFHWALNDFRMLSLIKTEAARAVGFPTRMTHGEADDWHFWLRFSMHGFRAVQCPVAVFNYRMQPGTISWPWSEGQATRTSEWLREAMEEARGLGVDLTDAALMLREVGDAALYASEAATLDPELEAITRGLSRSKWWALGRLLRQADSLAESLRHPAANARDIKLHMHQSRWLKLGRKLGFERTEMPQGGQEQPGTAKDG